MGREAWIECALQEYGCGNPSDAPEEVKGPRSYSSRLTGCQLSSTGALVAYSGSKTGRSPKDKRIVLNDQTKDIWWSHINMPIREKLYEYYLRCAKKYLFSHKHFVVDAYAGWDPKHRIGVRVYCQHPYHALFMQNMLVKVKDEEKSSFKPQFIIYNVGPLSLSSISLPDAIEADPSLDETLIALQLKKAAPSMVIYGTEYAGEMKKGILTYMMYLMPLDDHLPLHSSANVDDCGNVTFFFGLSGTGKTCLSADPKRTLIGDDEHVWTEEGIFNIEGGCYAKCIGLKAEQEPDIFHAIRYGAVLENVVLDENRVVDYDDVSITQNTRVSYPLSHIDKVQIPAVAGHPNQIIFLTCDASGLLPPLSKLTPEQAVFFFVSGYTSKIAGTEVGVKEPIPTFSACFGEPFLVWSPLRYGELLRKKLKRHRCPVYLLNTGWIEGGYGIGKRIPLKYSRAMIDAIHSSSLKEYEIFPVFEFEIPKVCPNVPSEILNPMNLCSDKKLYVQKLSHLHEKFQENYEQKCVIFTHKINLSK